MRCIIIVCEGQTEEIFVKNVLGPYLEHNHVFVLPRLIPTSKKQKGGALSYHRVKLAITKMLRERSDNYVTTFFDLYGLPSSFPRISTSNLEFNPIDNAKSIETIFHTDVIGLAKRRPERFFPHIQPHEFESLLFSDTAKFREVNPHWEKYVESLIDTRKAFQSPEHINSSQETHPSARLQSILHPRFRKAVHGVKIAEKIGIECIRGECHHFNEWLSRMESLPPI